MDAAAPSSARGVSEELAPVPRVAAAADDAGWVIRPAEIRCWMERIFLAAEAASLLWVLLILAMELMMGKEPIASERGECVCVCSWPPVLRGLAPHGNSR